MPLQYFLFIFHKKILKTNDDAYLLVILLRCSETMEGLDDASVVSAVSL